MIERREIKHGVPKLPVVIHVWDLSASLTVVLVDFVVVHDDENEWNDL